uniref:U24-theraphotoxin-Cg1a n=1 Tax=Chilobrachys guangxiensis TaxID=278060 RepID=JZT27_CHIGU|nr:RecName: Full=U24-theraphotoxin-Cg1a; Short=U24-TRTX-Cg1a; AltName: Full=Jingzhaotoxin-27; Short=JZTX-27; AltName: Full=Peptide F2-36.12; Flags: Precursor [Chilobrachys guangxiensis]ABY71722.1 cystine knot toxin [Chilobrachys guangxiensis]
MRVLFIIAVLALISVGCYASEMKDRSSRNEVLSAIFAIEEPQERDCLGLFWICNYMDDKCCPGYKCERSSPWCKIDIWG